MFSLHDGLLVCYSLFPKNSSVCSAEQTLQNFVALKDTVFPLLKLLFSLMMLLYFLFYFFFPFIHVSHLLLDNEDICFVLTFTFLLQWSFLFFFVQFIFFLFIIFMMAVMLNANHLFYT